MMYALVAVGFDGNSVILAHHGDGPHEDPGHCPGSAWEAEFEQGSNDLYEMGMKTPEKPGIYSWVGIKLPDDGAGFYDSSKSYGTGRYWLGDWEQASDRQIKDFIEGNAINWTYPKVWSERD